MYLVAIAWIYVVLMMAVAEALSSQGSLIGALFTFLLYGLLPLSLLLYILGTPLRKRRLQRLQEGSSGDGNGRSHAASGAVAPERKEL